MKYIVMAGTGTIQCMEPPDLWTLIAIYVHMFEQLGIFFLPQILFAIKHVNFDNYETHLLSVHLETLMQP